MAWVSGAQHTRTTTREHRAWRLAVLKRDAWVCQLRYEGCAGRATQADHVLATAFGGAEYDLANGQAVCVPCHKRKTQAESAEGMRRRSRLRPREQHPGMA